jgi:predicted kinase
MSGYPGSGKSTLARKVAEQTTAIILDHDIIKSSHSPCLYSEMVDKGLNLSQKYTSKYKYVEPHR